MQKLRGIQKAMISNGCVTYHCEKRTLCIYVAVKIFESDSFGHLQMTPKI